MLTIPEFFHSLFPKARLNRSLRILIGVNTVLVFTVGLFAPFYAVFVQHIGGSIAFAGFSWAVFAIVTGVFVLLFSNWGLSVKEPELLLAFGYMLRGAVFVSYAFMASMPQLILTQLLWGLATAVGSPAFDVVYSEHTEKENSFMEWGRWEGISSIAAGCAALLGGILIQNFGYEILFISIAAICFLLGIYIWQLPRDVL